MRMVAQPGTLIGAISLGSQCAFCFGAVKNTPVFWWRFSGEEISAHICCLHPSNQDTATRAIMTHLELDGRSYDVCHVCGNWRHAIIKPVYLWHVHKFDGNKKAIAHVACLPEEWRAEAGMLALIAESGHGE